MSVHNGEILFPEGMDTVTDAPFLSENKARSIIGFLPGRNKALYQSPPLQKLLMTAISPSDPQHSPPLSGVAWYHNTRPTDFAGERTDMLVVFSLGFLTLFYVDYDSGTDRGRYTLRLTRGPIIPFEQVGYQYQTFRWVQYEDELFFVAEGLVRPQRLLIDENGIPVVLNMGIDAPKQPPTATGGGSGLTGTYYWKYTYEDGKGRESSPSPVSAGLFLNDDVGTVTVSYSSDPQVKRVNLYRTLANDASVFFRETSFVNLIAGTTVAVTSNMTDALLSAEPYIAPSPGYNDPPAPATIIAICADRIFLNDISASKTTFRDTGTAAGTSTVQHLDRASGVWQANQFTFPRLSYRIRITGGTGVGQTRNIRTNTATSIYPDVNFNTAPDNTSTYEIYKPSDAAGYNRVQVSNLYSPTQFASVADPEDLNAGESLYVGTNPGDPVTGIRSMGTTCAVWKRDGLYEVLGEGQPFIVRGPIHEKGCTAPDSIVTANGVLYWQGKDGFYAMGGGYDPKKISPNIENLFTGFVPGSTLNG